MLEEIEKTLDKEGAVLRTPVREKVRRINSRKVKSQGKFPEKQYKVSQFFGRKSPRAEKAKEILGQKKGAKANLNIENQGATCSPLLGDTGQPGIHWVPSTDPGQELRKEGGPGRKRQPRGPRRS